MRGKQDDDPYSLSAYTRTSTWKRRLPGFILRRVSNSCQYCNIGLVGVWNADAYITHAMRQYSAFCCLLFC